jgi:(4S)-4-hydroxy-5-phosphonooxypentane-2,3-dione isomerase
MMTIIAHYQARPGEGDRVAAILAAHVAATRTESGCVQFIAYRTEDDGDRFLLYEQYADEAALEAHRASPHFRRYVQDTIIPLLAERQVARYQEVEADLTTPGS